MSLSCALEDLPVELLVLIFNYLDHPAQKVFRCLSQHFCAFADPQLFSTVALDLDRGGYSSLCAISEHTRFREYVKTLHLERRIGLADFGDFETWENSTIFDYKEPEVLKVLGSPQLRPGSLSLETWSMLSRDERLILHEDYEKDRIQMKTDAEELAAAMCSLFESGYPIPAAAATPSSRTTNAQSLLEKLYRAIAALPNIKTLQHHPAYLEDDWRTHWRELRFHPNAIILYCSSDGDKEIDAVQLCLVLHALASSSGPMHRLQAVELFTGGIGFWNSTTLHHLLNWAELEYFDSEDLILENWLATEQPSVTLRRQEEMTRQLCTMESAFTWVTILDWTIYNEDAMPTACRFLGRVLRKCEDLQLARLAIRHDTPYVAERYIYHKRDSLAVVPMEKTIRVLDSASTELFGLWSTSPRLGTLTTLELSMATTEAELWGLLKKTTRLRHVILRQVTMLPGNGCWNELLRKMSEGLKLTSVKLVGLEDVWNERPRLVLDPEASPWVECDKGTHWYRAYESAIVEYVLRQESRFPILSASEFLERECKMGVSP